MSVLILTDKDLFLHSNNKDIVSFSDFKDNQVIRKSDLVVYFKDKSWEFKIIKSRFDDPELPEEVLNEIRYRKLNWVLS